MSDRTHLDAPTTRESRARRAATVYRKTLAEMKRRGLTVNDMPDDVAQSALVLHQNALVVAMVDRQCAKAGEER